MGLFAGESADVIGSGSFKLDPSSQGPVGQKMVRLFEIQSTKEVGQCFVDLNLEISSFEHKIFKDNQVISQVYYDAYCEDASVIKSNLA
jgi:hypothetical protein